MKTLSKTLVLGAAAAAMSLTAFAASAQTYRGGHNPNYSGSYSRSYDHRDNDRHDNRGWNNRSYAYNGYNRGYAYDRRYYDNRDNSAGAALLGGVVGLMLGTALADHGSSYQQPYGYSSYGYQQPYYGYGY